MTFPVVCVVGARPNFVKIQPILQAFKNYTPKIEPILLHTGQHYDQIMSDIFFQQLGIPAPDVSLNVGSGSHGQQTAEILMKYEAWLQDQQITPAATLVVGDVNSTLACSLASVKLGIPVVHVEAGLRSFDRNMPEEINRIVTDSISELLLVSDPSGIDNLKQEGRPDSAIRLIGNVMIDVLKSQLKAAQDLKLYEQFNVQPQQYILWTMHRPSNVDNAEHLNRLVTSLQKISEKLPIIFPAHPRTKTRLEAAELWNDLEQNPRVFLHEPFGYHEFLSLSSNAKIVITDSGGLQEETTVLEVPCLTLRENTERPITVNEGTSTLIGTDLTLLEKLVDDVLNQQYKSGHCPSLWDGQAGKRVAEEVFRFLTERKASDQN